MELRIINSDSDGNAYILKANNGAVLLIELGTKFDEIMEALDYKIDQVVCALVTHEHGDHSKAVKEAMRRGIDVWATKGTLDALGANRRGTTTEMVIGHRACELEPMVQYRRGDFTIVAFPVEHDATEPVGFLIHHPECGMLLFATDTSALNYRFPGLENILIEANYDSDILDDKTEMGFLPMAARERLLNSHFGLGQAIGFILDQDISRVRNIVLLHLSARNSNAASFKLRMEQATGKPVTIADNGVIVNLDKFGF